MDFIKRTIHASLSDQELIALYKQSGNLETLAELYQRYMELLYGVCLKYLKEPEVSRDAVMNIFEELIEKLRKHEVDHFRGWLYSVARNHCLMQLRSGKQVRISEFDADHMQMEGELHLNGILEKEQQYDQLTGCLKNLPAEQKTAVSLFYLEQKSYKEIEAITGMDWNRVRSQIQNGRRNLKICMEKTTFRPHNTGS